MEIMACFLSLSSTLLRDFSAYRNIKYFDSRDLYNILIFVYFRKELPKDFIVGVKVNSVEFQAGGLETDDARIMCSKLEVRTS